MVTDIRNRIVVTVCLFLFFVLINCGKDNPTGPTSPTSPTTPTTPTTPAPPVPTRITITPASATLNAIGQTVQLRASVVDANNNAIPGATVSWTSANTAVATVSAQGLVTAVANGSTQVSARSGNLTGQANVTVAQTASRVTITPASATLNEIGQTVQLKASVVDAKNNPVPGAVVSWSSANTAIATVNAQGLVTAVANGMTQITARSGSITGRVTLTVMGPDRQREVLVKLYNATDGENWTNKGGWLSEGPLGSWYGVSTNENGQVIRISLHENNLKGTLIPELEQLASLETLALSANQLTGIIPPEIGQLDKLTLLYLWGNQLTGTIPPEIGQLATLEKLSLAENQLTGNIPPEIWQLTNLTRLNLHKNQLTGSIPPEIGQLVDLAELYLSSNQLTGNIPPELGQLTNHTELYLWDNQLTGVIPPELGQLTNLVELSLSSNQLTGTIPSEFGQFADLTELYLSSNQLTGNIPPEIGQLANLTVLSLHTNRLEGTIPPEIGNLTQLTRLSLANNELSGAIEPELLQLVNLTELLLQGTGVCAPTDAEFMEWLSGISEQNVANCADVRPGFAPANQREFDARFVGKVLSTTRTFDIEFTSEGRYAEPVGEPPAGSYTYSITGTNTGRLTQIGDTRDGRCTSALTFTAHDKGSFEYKCGTQTQYAASGLWRLTDAPDPDSFNIEIAWIGEQSDPSVVEAANVAAARWERVITGDLSDVRFGASSETVTVDDLFDNGDYERLFGYVDDLVIYVEIASIDGEKGAIAKAGPNITRSSSSLPVVGSIVLDTDDLSALSPVALYDTILHEIAHVLGFGSLWSEHNLLENPSLDSNDEPILPPPDTHFTGMEAVSAFDDVGGRGYRGAKVPVENEEGGKGTLDSHWRNSVIGPEELMDGFINREAAMRQPMSPITIRSLADLGYEVDESQADVYFLPTTTLARRLEGTSGDWIPLNCIVR